MGVIPHLDNDSTTMPSSSRELASDEGETMAQITINEGLAWLKTTNARTAIEAYDQDDAVLGELS